jgi:hypothetical protein
MATVGNEIDSLEGAEPRFLRFSSYLAPFAAPHDAHGLCGRWRTLLSATGQERSEILCNTFQALAMACATSATSTNCTAMDWLSLWLEVGRFQTTHQLGTVIVRGPCSGFSFMGEPGLHARVIDSIFCSR